MNKSKMLWCALLLAVATNVVLLWKCFGRPGHLGRKQEPKAFVMNKLRFDNQQCEQYEILIAQHRRDISALEQNVLNARREVYMGLKSNTQPSDSMVALIAAHQSAIEHIHYRHFADIKAICKPEQLSDFELLIPELPGLFQPKPKRPN